MKFEKPKLKFVEPDGTVVECVLFSFEEFKQERGLHNVPNQTLDYAIDKDRLDYVILGRFRYIIWNRKAREFNLSYQKAKAA